MNGGATMRPPPSFVMPEHYRYRAYGLTISSVIPLPELTPESEPRAVDVEITLGDVPPRAGKHANANVSGTSDSLFFGRPDRAAFYVHAGRTIVVQPAPDVALDVVRPFILGSALAAILHQRSFLPLHASAVTHLDSCIAFLGDKGSGKSTMAAFLARQQREVVTDDICAITCANEQALVWPNFQRQRLHDDVVEHLGVSDSSAFRIEGGKLAVAVHTTIGFDPRPLRALFVLADAPVISISRLDKTAALGALLAHTFRPRHIIAMSAELAHMQRCAQVLSHAPVYTLARPRDLARLPEVHEALRACLQRQASN